MGDRTNRSEMVEGVKAVANRLMSIVFYLCKIALKAALSGPVDKGLDAWILCSIKDRTPDPNHPVRRCYTTEYRAKKKVVYYFWLTSLLCMLILPSIGFVTSAGLFTTFISFSYLDEA